jgi:hypothetical protein
MICNTASLKVNHLRLYLFAVNLTITPLKMNGSLKEA